MVNIIGVRFRNIGKVYYFDPKGFELKAGDHVIVETAKGIEYGRVVFPPKEVEDSRIVRSLRPVLRPANEADEKKITENSEKEREAYRICVEKIREHNLEMKLIDVEVTFDNSKILFYFTAEGRIDFRLLVKDLASIFKTRIELRQIGVRDETKILGGLGICGRELCCRSYLTDFVPVSIRMAKEQNLSLNQTKISGVCGRLMCCLKNEQETYEDLNRKLPGVGDVVTLPDGTTGRVHSVNVLRQLVKVTVEVDDEKELEEFPASELVYKPRKKKGKAAEKEASAQEDLPSGSDLQELPEEILEELPEDFSSDGYFEKDFSPSGGKSEKAVSERKQKEGRKGDSRRREAKSEEADFPKERKKGEGKKPGKGKGGKQENRPDAKPDTRPDAPEGAKGKEKKPKKGGKNSEEGGRRQQPRRHPKGNDGGNEA